MKPKLLLIHGWAMHAGIFSEFCELLRSDYQVRAIDLPGHGERAEHPLELESCLDYLQAEVDAFGQCWILGWSLGGMLAAALCVRQQGRKFTPATTSVLGLIALASTPSFVQRADWPHAIAPAQLAKLSLELEQNWQQVVERFLALETFGSEHERAELRFLRSQVYARGQPSLQALRAGLEMLESADLRSQKLLGLPNLWIAGSRDRLCPAQAMEAAAQQFEGRFACLQGAAHAPFLSHAEALKQMLIEFTSSDSNQPEPHRQAVG